MAFASRDAHIILRSTSQNIHTEQTDYRYEKPSQGNTRTCGRRHTLKSPTGIRRPNMPASPHETLAGKVTAAPAGDAELNINAAFRNVENANALYMLACVSVSRSKALSDSSTRT